MIVFTNTAVSLDGRIGTPDYAHVAIGSPTDLAYMSVVRARADAVIVGGQTFRNWPLPLVPDPDAIAGLRAAGFPDTDHPPLEDRRWWNVVVSRKMEVPTAGRFYQDPRVRPLFLTSAPACPDLPPHAEVARAPEVTIPWILEQLRARGVERLLIEGGGDMLFQFLAAGAIDEFYVTICPRLVGGKGAPSLIDGAGFGADQIRQLRLRSLHRFGDELYARYQVLREQGCR